MQDGLKVERRGNSPNGRMNHLAPEELAIVHDLVEDLRLGDESSSTQPLRVLWLKLAIEQLRVLLDIVSRGNGVEGRRSGISRCR